MDVLKSVDRDYGDLLDKYPALKIFESFQGLRRKENAKSVEFVMNRGLGASQTMKELKPITPDMIEKSMEGWRL